MKSCLLQAQGFVFQSSEIYGGLNGFFDYGPLGVELGKHQGRMVGRHGRRRDGVVGLDSGIIMNPSLGSIRTRGRLPDLSSIAESKMRTRRTNCLLPR